MKTWLQNLPKISAENVIIFISKMQVFDMFDIKRDGVISFGEFVRSLSIFHPNTSEEKKIECTKSFVYYMNQTLFG